MSTQDIDDALFGDGKLADQLAETFRLIALAAWEEGHNAHPYFGVTPYRERSVE